MGNPVEYKYNNNNNNNNSHDDIQRSRPVPLLHILAGEGGTPA